MITFLCALLLGTSVTITLPAEAKVQGTELSLGSVATVTCDDAELAARVQALSLGYAPAPGFSRVLEAGALSRQIRAVAPGVDVKLVGPTTCRVFPETEAISAESITNAARGALEQHCRGQDFGDCTLELATPVAAIEVPKGKQACALEVAPLPAKPTPGGMLVAVRLVVDGQTYRTAYTSWRVQVWREQPVLTRAVRFGEVLDSSMIEVKRAPLDPALSASALEAVQVIGTAAARELPAGKPLQAGDLVRPQVVKKGDALILEVSTGAVRVRTPVIASQAGAQGDRIKVVVQQTGRELNAVVTGRDRVRVELAGQNTQGAHR